jgi:TolB-like protein
VLRCLERDPAQRVADAPTVARELSAWLAAAGAESAPRGASLAGSSMSPSVATPGGPGAQLGTAASSDRSASVSTPSTTGQKPPVASLLKGNRGLAVLAFAYRGPADQDWLPSGIRDELIDVLSRTRGLRVLGRGAVEKLKDERDPRAIGSALAVDFVVDGTAQVAGTKLRVTARLMDVGTGAQIWSERFDAELEDLFVVQERVGQRIAEALRLGMHAVDSPTPVPPDALELYLRARRAARTVGLARPVEIVALLEQVIERAPDFAPAYAAHAIACVRAWFTPHAAVTRNWQEVAEESVARALERAPDLAETHFAQAQLMSQQGRYREAVRAAQTALGIAPTLPEAHQFLACLQLEAGRAKEGLQRIELALGLEPTLSLAMIEKSRWHGLYGDIEVFRGILAQWESDPASDGIRAQQMIRVGAYRGDEDLIRRGIELMSRVSHPAGPYLILYARSMLGEISAEDGVRPVLELLRSPVSSRFRSLIHQMASEGWGREGDAEKTLEHFRNGATSVLVDLEWIDRCPFLECIRKRPEFAELRRVVRTRCEEIWSS